MGIKKEIDKIYLKIKETSFQDKIKLIIPPLLFLVAGLALVYYKVPPSFKIDPLLLLFLIFVPGFFYSYKNNHSEWKNFDTFDKIMFSFKGGIELLGESTYLTTIAAFILSLLTFIPPTIYQPIIIGYFSMLFVIPVQLASIFFESKYRTPNIFFWIVAILIFIYYSNLLTVSSLERIASLSDQLYKIILSLFIR